jgi:hypothetical protein
MRSWGIKRVHFMDTLNWKLIPKAFEVPSEPGTMVTLNGENGRVHCYVNNCTALMEEANYERF